MKKACLLLLVLLSLPLLAQNQPSFDAHFTGEALRVDLYQTGDASEEFISVARLACEPAWPGSRTRLIDLFNNGRYELKVYEVATNTLIFSSGFDCMYGEYRTTDPALAGIKHTFPRSVRFPFPKYPVNMVIEKRDKNNLPAPFFLLKIDPADYHISRESVSGGKIYDAHISGEAALKADLLFVAEGYTAAEEDKFRNDVDRMRDYLFTIHPYQELKDKINLRGLFLASPQSAMDEPRQGAWKNTALNASFNAFDLDRYMLIVDGHLLRRLASQAPYDALIVLVNSTRYGGGGIYNDYCVTSVDNRQSKTVFVHELGHSFAGLGDEYYASDVAYNDFYPKGVEPLEPNITALLNPGQIKWQSLLTPGAAVPTDWDKARLDSLQALRGENGKAMNKAVEAAKAKGAGETQLEKIKKPFEERGKKIGDQIAAISKNNAHLTDVVAAFEGAGYASKGLYRPMLDCKMITNTSERFCRVCEAAIARMISHYGD